MKTLLIILLICIACAANAQKPLSALTIDMVTLNESLERSKPEAGVEVIMPITNGNKERGQCTQMDKSLENVVTRSGCIIVTNDIQPSKEQVIWHYFGISYWD